MHELWIRVEVEWHVYWYGETNKRYQSKAWAIYPGELCIYETNFFTRSATFVNFKKLRVLLHAQLFVVLVDKQEKSIVLHDKRDRDFFRKHSFLSKLEGLYLEWIRESARLFDYLQLCWNSPKTNHVFQAHRKA